MATKKYKYIVHYINKKYELGSMTVNASDCQEAVFIAKRKLGKRIEKEHLYYFHAKRLKT